MGDVSEDEEHWGGYQKDRLLDNADANADNDIWMMNDGMNFALDGEGHLDGDDEEDSNGDGNEGGKGKDGDRDDEIAWEYDHGPRGRTRFDEYCDARRAKNKRRKEGLGGRDRL